MEKLTANEIKEMLDLRESCQAEVTELYAVAESSGDTPELQIKRYNLGTTIIRLSKEIERAFYFYENQIA
jgi:hypothetical protein